MMEKLVSRFKKIFHNYDYENYNIDVITELLDIILEMMKIVDVDDVDDMKRLSSFVKVLSSDFCRDVINPDVIDDIYTEQIIPIFIKLINKYPEKKCELRNLPEHIVAKFIEKTKATAKKVVNAVKKSFRYNDNISEDFNDDEKYFTEDQDETLFGMLKRTGDQLPEIYDNIIKKKGDDNDILRELRDIQVSASVSSVHYNPQINLLSMCMKKLSDFFIDSIINKDYKSIQENKEGLEESFRFMHNIHYAK